MANDDVLFTGWGEVVAGREQKALTVFQETIQYWTLAQQDGRIDSFEPVLLDPHGGGIAGFVLVRGERARLDAIRADEEFERIVARAGLIVHDFGVIPGYVGEKLGRQLALFERAAEELGG
jgi:GNAT superfamily N-acetyltransferase